MPIKRRTNHLLMIALCHALPVLAYADNELDSLQPLMNVPAKVVYSSDFDAAAPVNKSDWQRRQGTRWTIANGVLRGQQSSPEFQASKSDHQGFDPRIKSLKTPPQFIAKFSVRFIDGDETSLLPLIEFGHHNVRLKFSKSGVKLLADHECVLLAETSEVKLISGHWYHLLAERNGDQFVVQFVDGPTLYGKHASLAIPVEPSDGLGIAGPRRGFVEIDNVTLWSIKPILASTWQATADSLPRFEPQVIEKKKNARGKKQKKQ